MVAGYQGTRCVDASAPDSGIVEPFRLGPAEETVFRDVHCGGESVD